MRIAKRIRPAGSRKAVLLTAVIVALTVATTPSNAELMFAVDPANDQLVSIETATGAVQIHADLDRDIGIATLTMANGYLYVLNCFFQSHTELLKLDPSDGSVLEALPVTYQNEDVLLAEGLVYLEGRFLTAFRTGTNQFYSNAIGEISSDGSLNGVVDYTTFDAGADCDALGHNAEGHLLWNDGRTPTDTRLFFDAGDYPNSSYTLLGEYSPNARLNDFAWAGTDLWAISGLEFLYLIDPADGSALDSTAYVWGFELQGLASGSSITSADTVESSFDTDRGWWVVTGDNDVLWQETGGNPGGYLKVIDLATGIHNYAFGPHKFLGNWSNLTASDSLSVDIFLHNTSGGPLGADCPYWTFEIVGPGGRAVTIDGCVDLPPEDVWTNYKVPLDESAWNIESGNWTDLLAEVSSLRINAEFIHGDEWVGIDNVRLTSTPTPIFNPCVESDFNSPGTGAWTFQGTGGYSNPGSGGNGGGYVEVVDVDGHSFAYVPSAFLGDWSNLDGSGSIRYDVRIISHPDVDPGLYVLIKLSGPGGTAHVDLDPSVLPDDRQIWKTLEVPIESSAWTVDSGTWTDLLASVQECRLTLEWYSGAEVIGMDNFGRGDDDCPPIDNPIQIYDPDVVNCGFYSLIRGSSQGTSVALNPMDGEVYGTVWASTGSGGGLYEVTGPDPGRKLHAYDNPGHVIFDTDGDAFVSLPGGGEIHRLEWGGSSSLWVSGFHSGDDDPIGMTFAPPGFNGPNVQEGDIMVVDSGYGGPDEIWAFSPDTAENEQLVVPDPGEFEWLDICASQDGTVYFCDFLDPDDLSILHPDGTFSFLPLSQPIGQLCSIVYDDLEGQIYVAEYDNKGVWRIDPSTGESTLIADGFAGFYWCPLEIDVANNRLWVADHGYNRVYELCLGAPVGVVEGPTSSEPNLMLRAAPNPFRGTTRISFATPSLGPVSLRIFDIRGRLVRGLHSGRLPAGPGSFLWDGRTDEGRLVPSGAYFCRLKVDNYVETGRVVLLK